MTTLTLPQQRLVRKGMLAALGQLATSDADARAAYAVIYKTLVPLCQDAVREGFAAAPMDDKDRRD